MALAFDVKAVLLGDRGAGKSCLLQSWATREWGPCPPTYGTGFGARRVPTAEQRPVAVGAWDTSGNPVFRPVAMRFIPGADAAVVCFDATSRGSWEALRVWVHEARRLQPGIVVVLVACKVDLAEREAPAEQPLEQAAVQQQQQVHHLKQQSQQSTTQQDVTQQHHLEKQLQQQQQVQGMHGELASGSAGSGAAAAAIRDGEPASPSTPFAAAAQQRVPPGVDDQDEAASPAPGGSSSAGRHSPASDAGSSVRSHSGELKGWASTAGWASSSHGPRPPQLDRQPYTKTVSFTLQKDTSASEPPRKRKQQAAPLVPTVVAPALAWHILRRYAAELQAPLVLASAKSGEGVAEVFKVAASEVMLRQRQKALSQAQAASASGASAAPAAPATPLASSLRTADAHLHSPDIAARQPGQDYTELRLSGEYRRSRLGLASGARVAAAERQAKHNLPRYQQQYYHQQQDSVQEQAPQAQHPQQRPRQHEYSIADTEFWDAGWGGVHGAGGGGGTEPLRAGRKESSCRVS